MTRSTENLWVCADPTLPYRVGTHWNWKWIIPGEPLLWHRPGLRPYSVIAIHPMDEKYPFHRWVGGLNAKNIPSGRREGEKEPAEEIYTWLAYIHGEKMSGHMPFWDAENPNFSFPENRPEFDLTKAYCGRCSFCDEVYYSDGVDYACEGCKS